MKNIDRIVALFTVYKETNDYIPENHILSYNEIGLKIANKLLQKYKAKIYTLCGEEKAHFLNWEKCQKDIDEIQGRDYFDGKVSFSLFFKKINEI